MPLPEKRPVRCGLQQLATPMTKAQALRHGERHMPRDLKAAGFQTVVLASDLSIHGGLWFRINDSMARPGRSTAIG